MEFFIDKEWGIRHYRFKESVGQQSDNDYTECIIAAINEDSTEDGFTVVAMVF